MNGYQVHSVHLSLYKCQGVKILFNPILSYFFDKILFCPFFWEMSYFILIFGHFAFNFGIL